MTMVAIKSTFRARTSLCTAYTTITKSAFKSSIVSGMGAKQNLQDSTFIRYSKFVHFKDHNRNESLIRCLMSSTAADSTTSELEAKSQDSTAAYDILNKQKGIIGNYDPASFESQIYDWWEKSKCFEPSMATDKKPYVLPMPPPNVTGRLHMGHAIFVALQDVLARFHRMRGRPVLWLPGTDHAGIATQLQVEKQLAAQDPPTTRQEVGREAFLEKVWQYKEEQGGAITSQLRCLGASADWSRERFTMDSDLSEAVVEAFCRLNDKGLIYRGEYMVNWAPGLQTAVSDLEVDYSDEEGKLYYFKYMIANSQEYLPVATTRPETIFGDTAVCVHPQDERYKHLIGKEAVVPILGRKIPIIADEYVDMEFGTGALKITPGHDPNDYAIGKKFDLPIINIMNKDGSLNSNSGPNYENLDRFNARSKLWSDMEASDLTLKVEPHMQRVPRSQRGGEIIEPLVSRQWFVKTEGMGKKALAAVNNGDITIVPSRFNKTWNNWLTDIHDWCISRQLWWGHRIPVWYVVNDKDDETQYIVARNEEEARSKALDMGHSKDVKLRQEDDVLDTWFSSGLWPFATCGWPNEESEDLERFYPATCLETGYDILFFWVARMVMLGIELTGKSPFEVVYLHGLVRAADGTKMSKTKGNVIDPLDTVSEYGADSLRYSLVTGVTPGQDIPLNMEKVDANRNFCNKLWNACKFVTINALQNADEQEIANLSVTGPLSQEEFQSLPLPERYIVSNCHELVNSVTADIENYSLGSAGSKIYEFLWDQFADWYIEISKTRLYEAAGGSQEEAKAARRVLVYILDTCLRLLHPFMPYVTEHLWHHLPRADPVNGSVNSIMLSTWPRMDDSQELVSSQDDVAMFEAFQAMTRGIRNARAEYNVDQGKKISATVVASQKYLTEFEREKKSLVALCRLEPSEVTFVSTASQQAKDAASEESIQIVVQDGIEVILPLSGLIDPVKERERLKKQFDKLQKEIEKLAQRLNSKGFLDKAPAMVVDKAREELAELEGQAAKVQQSLAALS